MILTKPKDFSHQKTSYQKCQLLVNQVNLIQTKMSFYQMLK